MRSWMEIAAAGTLSTSIAILIGEWLLASILGVFTIVVLFIAYVEFHSKGDD